LLARRANIEFANGEHIDKKISISPLRGVDMFCLAAKRDGVERGSRIATLVAEGNISNFERSEKYIELARSGNISSCNSNISTKEQFDLGE
jgi:hypothetical protein